MKMAGKIRLKKVKLNTGPRKAAKVSVKRFKARVMKRKKAMK